MKEFEGKVVLVTGGTSGIGTAVAKAFAIEGAKVVLTGRRTDLGGEVVESIKHEGGEAFFIKTDVRNPDDVKRMVDDTVKKYGGLNIAVNNAGVEQNFTPLSNQTLEDYDFIMETNLRGVWLSAKYETAVMMGSGGGAIINMSSIFGVVGAPLAPLYVASKHAVIGLTKALALEFAEEGIRVNAVLPGAVSTPMIGRFAKDQKTVQYLNSLHPVGRIAESEEITGAVLYLASDRASFVTGTSLRVDGGFTAQ